MNLLIDESVDRQILEKLRQDGHHVVYVSDLDVACPNGADIAPETLHELAKSRQAA